VRGGCHAVALAKAGFSAARGRLKYVYILKSVNFPDAHYVGATIDLRKRFRDHNAGASAHTRKFRPWALVTYLAFEDHAKADAFESYLKSASGRAFAKRHF
jgi:putative endonuclease